MVNGRMEIRHTSMLHAGAGWQKGAMSLKKGQRIIVHGKLKGRSFVRQDGSNGYAYEVEAIDIGSSVMSKGQSKETILPDLENPW